MGATRDKLQFPSAPILYTALSRIRGQRGRAVYQQFRNNPVTSMIHETQIAKFVPDKQAEIRQTIESLVKLGHNPDHLMLAEDGTVLIDGEAVTLDSVLRGLKDL
jgi:hypothetical protein